MLETDSQEFTQNYIQNEQVVGFQIPIGLPPDMADAQPVNGLIARPIDSQDVSQGTLHIGHLRGRVLPVAVAKFIDLMIIALGERFPEDLDQ